MEMVTHDSPQQSIVEVPHELLISHLSLQSLYNLRCVNKKFQNICLYHKKSIITDDLSLFQKLFFSAIKNNDESFITHSLQLTDIPLSIIKKKYPYLHISMICHAAKHKEIGFLQRLAGNESDKYITYKSLSNINSSRSQHKYIMISCQDASVSPLSIYIENNKSEQSFISFLQNKNTCQTLSLTQVHNTDLIEAALKNNDLQAAIAFLLCMNNECTQPQVDDYAQTVLTLSSDDTYAAELIKLLIYCGADKSRLKVSKMLPIIESAIKKNQIGNVQFLINNYIDNLEDHYVAKQSCLSFALKAACYEIIKYLIEEKNISLDKSSINKKFSGRNMTYLHRAAERNQYFLVQILVNMRADCNKKDASGHTALTIALKHKNNEIAFYLMEQQEDNDKNRSNFIYEAIKTGNAAALEVLLQKYEFNIDYKDSSGNTLLHHAIFHQYLPIVELLIKKNANLTIANNSGLTPVMLAIQKGLHNIYTYIIDGSDQTKTNEYVDLAIQYNNVYVINKLLINDTVNNKISEGNTPLHRAILLKSEIHTIDALLKKNALIHALNNHGETPLSLAIKNRKQEIIELLLKYTEINDISLPDSTRSLYHQLDGTFTALCTCVTTNNKSLFNKLITIGCDYTQKDDTGRTLLHHAIRHDRNLQDFFEILSCSHINEQDTLGNTALHYAIINQHVAHVQTLIDAGAELHVANNDNETPFDLIVQSKNHCNSYLTIPHIVTSITTPDKKGHTYLEYLLSRYFSTEVKSQSCKYIIPNVDYFVATNKITRIDLPDKINSHVLQEVIDKHASLELITPLLANVKDINALTNNNHTLLWNAYHKNRRDIIIVLSAHGAQFKDSSEINAQDEQGNTLLHHAIKKNNYDNAKIFINAGADLQIANKNNETPLDLIVQGKPYFNDYIAMPGLVTLITTPDKSGHAPLDCMLSQYFSTKLKSPNFSQVLHNVDLLVEQRKHTIRISLPNTINPHVLQEVINKNASLKLITLLLANVHNINSPTSNQHTLLWNAIYDKKVELIQLFLDHGADINEKSTHGKLTPLEYAMNARDETLIELFSTKTVDDTTVGTSAFFSVTYTPEQNILDLVLFIETDTNQKNNCEETCPSSENTSKENTGRITESCTLWNKSMNALTSIIQNNPRIFLKTTQKTLALLMLSLVGYYVYTYGVHIAAALH